MSLLLFFLFRASVLSLLGRGCCGGLCGNRWRVILRRVLFPRLLGRDGGRVLSEQRLWLANKPRCGYPKAHCGKKAIRSKDVTFQVAECTARKSHAGSSIS